MDNIKLHIIYHCYLDSSDWCDYEIWLKRHHPELNSKEINQCLEYRDSPEGVQQLHSMAWD